MEKERLHHIMIYYVIPGMVFLTLINLTFALNPPVDQKYNALFANLSEGNCENCHTSGVPERHHMLVPGGEYSCENCHQIINGSSQFTIVRDCMQCHNSSFNNVIIRMPHHETQDAQNRQCGSCHGSWGSDHLGENWDCNVCHAYWVGGLVRNGTIPYIDSLSLNKIYEGNSTQIIIRGNNLMTTIDNVNQSSDVIMSNGVTIINLSSNSINSNEIIVNIPALNRGNYGIYILKNGEKSNKFALTVIPRVTINSAMKSGKTIIINGSGFGVYDPVYKSLVNVSIKDINGVSRVVDITNWTNSTINVDSSDTLIGDIATVNSIYGFNSIKINNK